MKIMKNVLATEKRASGVHQGFRARENTIFTYTQQRVGFNYFYVKRKIGEDGIHSTHLDLVLNPWPRFHRYVFARDRSNPFCISYPFELEMNHLKFLSVEHYLVYSSTLHHLGMEKAKEVQKLREIPKNALEASEIVSWYVKLPDVLEQVLVEKYRACQTFQQALNALDCAEIVFAGKDTALGCGMDYSIAILTDSN